MGSGLSRKNRMSDPVSNSEIEDVLASIRRLVSENARALKRDRERDPDAEKLVLTPAHRVDESDANAPSTDVFAVDTETWNDASRQPEPDETPVFFTHEARASRRAAALEAEAEAEDAAGVTADAADLAGAARAAATEGPAPVGAADDAGGREAGDESAETADLGESDLSGAAAESEDISPLERRIAELETAMQIDPRESAHAEVADSGDAAQSATGGAETADGSHDDHGAPVAAQDAMAEAKAEAPVEVAAAEAPPRSWIEGLVAAAAAAEAARLAERARAAAPAPSGDAQGADEAESGRDDAGEVPAAGEAVAEDGADAEASEAGQGAAAEAAEPLASVPLALTEDDNAPVEAEAPGGAEAEAAALEPDTAPDGDVTAAAAPETREDTDVDAPAEAGEPAPAPQRSWVDRLIAAAASLRTAPAADDDRRDTDTEAEATASDADATADLGDEAPAHVDTGTPQSDPDAPEAAPRLEPLNLVAPVVPGSQPDEEARDGTVAETAPVLEPSETDAAGRRDTVLTGPWTARAAAGEAHVATGATAQDGEHPPAQAADGADAARDRAADAAELEWEEVLPPTTGEPEPGEDETAAADDRDALAVLVAEAIAEETSADDREAQVPAEDLEAETAGDELGFAGFISPEDSDFQEFAEAWGVPGTAEAEPADTVGAGPDEAAQEPEPLDEDSAAVAAAAEADWDGADWEEVADAEIVAEEAVEEVSEIEIEMELEAEVDVPADETAGEAAQPVETDGAEAHSSDAPAEVPMFERSASRAPAEEETVIDEAMLRELVAQLVRDELQGTVGERITHNVRKLIRREIARALTLQDFEK
ncbi:MAG: hypothetical protein R3D80_21440 [Paracoccaceae bacterium]